LLICALAACAGGSEPADAPDGGAPTGADAGPVASVDAGPEADAGPADAGSGAPDAGPPVDAGAPIACSVSGVSGECMLTADCAALGETSTPGHCPGAADFQCCTHTPSVSDNPPTPTGYKPMTQAQVTPDMTTWAVSILHDPVTYPMFSTTTRTFGTQLVLARVEWHPPDFQNSVVHRGVTLYVPK
jgi:hypothetical protein